MRRTTIVAVRSVCEQAITEADAEEEAHRDAHELCPRAGTPVPSFVTAEIVLELVAEVERLGHELQLCGADRPAPDMDPKVLRRKLKAMHRRAQQAEQQLADRGAKRVADLLRQNAQDAAELSRVQAHNQSLIRMLHRHGIGGAAPVHKEGRP